MNERTGEEHSAFRGWRLREFAGQLARLRGSAIREWEAGGAGCGTHPKDREADKRPGEAGSSSDDGDA